MQQLIQIEGHGDPVPVPRDYYLVARNHLETWMCLAKEKAFPTGPIIRHADLVFNLDTNTWDEVNDEFLKGRDVVPIQTQEIVAVHYDRASQDKIPVIAEAGTWHFYAEHGMLILDGKKG